MSHELKDYCLCSQCLEERRQQLSLPIKTENLLKDKAKSRFNSACADILWSIAYNTPSQLPRDKTWDEARTEFTAKCWELFEAWETYRRV